MPTYRHRCTQTHHVHISRQSSSHLQLRSFTQSAHKGYIYLAWLWQLGEQGSSASQLFLQSFLRMEDPRHLPRPWEVGQQLLFYRCTSSHQRVDSALLGAYPSLLCSRSFPLGRVRLPPTEGGTAALPKKFQGCRSFPPQKNLGPQIFRHLGGAMSLQTS